MAVHLRPKSMGLKHGGRHPGFKSVQTGIASKQGTSTKRAGAILASSTREASAAAKRKNPKLRRVKARGGLVGKISKQVRELGETFQKGGRIKFLGGAGAVKFVNGKLVNIKQKKKTS